MVRFHSCPPAESKELIQARKRLAEALRRGYPGEVEKKYAEVKRLERTK